MKDDAREYIRVIIVEDEEGPAEVLKKTIEENLGEVDIRIEQDFEQAKALIKSHAYEAVVLDLFLGNPAQNDKEGQQVWEQIWMEKLVPVIIHTAGGCDLEPKVPTDNPFIRCITKHDGSDLEVAQHLKSITPYILALRQVEIEFNKVIHSVIEKVSPLIWQAETNEQLRTELLVRSARRRLAAMMDMKTLSTGESMLSWEQYINPPIDDFLLTGDILRMKDGKPDDPLSYRLVLTPSCDLEMHDGKCNVENLLVARCKNIAEYVKVIAGGANVKPSKLKEKLKSRITESQVSGYILLPEYVSVLPPMVAHLRDLELLPIFEIETNKITDAKFIRIASVDSPFREQIAWAYMQIAGRPGLPNRDLEKWINDILTALPHSS